MTDFSKKNEQIKLSGKLTRERHHSMICKTLKFKINYNKLTKKQQNTLKMQFVECKWVYNYILSKFEDKFNIDYKLLTNITHKDKQGNDVAAVISNIGSSVRQTLIQQIQTQIKSLSRLKSHGYNIGKLKYKSEWNCIELRQYGITHKINKNKVRIQGFDSWLPILGYKQLNVYANIEYANAKLLYDGHDYYFSLTCYIPKETSNQNINHIRGIDMGVSTTVTTSDGVKYDVMVEESERIKKLQRKLQRQVKGSNNHYKTKQKLKYAYIKLSNKRTDKANKIVHDLLKDCSVLVMQDEQIAGWKTDNKSDRNSKIQHSCLGTIKRKLMESPKVVMLERWYPTTKWCQICGTKTELALSDRTFKCSKCHSTEDRDIHAAKNMIAIYENYRDASGTGGTVKPVKKIAFKEAFLNSRKMHCL